MCFTYTRRHLCSDADDQDVKHTVTWQQYPSLVPAAAAAAVHARRFKFQAGHKAGAAVGQHVLAAVVGVQAAAEAKPTDSNGSTGIAMVASVAMSLITASFPQLSSKIMIRPHVMMVLQMRWHQAGRLASLEFHLWQLFTCLEDAVPYCCAAVGACSLSSAPCAALHTALALRT